LTSASARSAARLALSSLIAAVALLSGASAARANGPGGSGGVSPGGLAPQPKAKPKVPPPPSQHAPGTWLGAVTITEYWPAPEAWFVGRLVAAPGLTGRHRIDWLYSATGVSMQGEGFGLDGQMYHIDSLGDGGWVTVDGSATSPSDGWSGGPPFWRAGGYWTNRSGAVTFPLLAGGWSRGTGRRYVPLPGVTFARGESLPLSFYRSIAVDPSVIPLGSRVYVPAYRHDGYGGWFVAQDTGGAITGNHIDIYRSPPRNRNDSGQLLTGQRIFVVKARR
jgi:3D (Asp-Asp-Asp) domain-containing protein